MGRQPSPRMTVAERRALSANSSALSLAPPTEDEEREALSDGNDVTLEGAGLGSLFSASVLRWAASVLESAITYGDEGLGMRDTEAARMLAKHIRIQSEQGA